MRLGTETRTTIWVVLALQLVTAGGAIVLLSRMAPAIQNILEENVVSLSAVQRMQHALAGGDPRREQIFAQALAQAAANVTEAEERPLLARLRQASAAALRGEAQAASEVLAALEHLAAINLAAMHRSDERATNLGEAGAWAMAVLGMLCFSVSVIAARRVAQHITRPLMRIHETVAAFQRGDERRRCAIDVAAFEVGAIASAVDRLLDARSAGRSQPAGGAQAEASLRAALLVLLDQQPRPTLVLSPAGEVLAASQSALERLGTEDTLAATLRALPGAAASGAAAAAERGIELQPAGAELWLARLSDPASSA